MMLKDLTQKLTFLQLPGKHSRTQEKQKPEDVPLTGDPVTEKNKETDQLEAGPAEVLPEAPTESGEAEGEADFQAGMLACKEKNYAAAMETLLRAAGTGHREAQFLCGQLYQRGLTADADCKRALAWYKRAAKQGFLPAQMACAAMYEEGLGTAMNMKRALYWYEQAAKQGAVDAQLKCGRMYYCGRAENRNPKKARSWLETAAGLGNEDAKRLLNEFF